MLLMGKLTISMAIFNSYVKLPECIRWLIFWGYCTESSKVIDMQCYDFTTEIGNNTDWLVVNLSLWKNDGLRQWDDDPIYEMEHKIHVWNHQPDKVIDIWGSPFS